ncbi:MAG: hypothetical protein ACTS4V_01910, partial [Candidatus Hodgkinia cicadicola]
SSCFVRRSSFALPFSEGALLEIIWSAAPAAILASMCSTSLVLPPQPTVTVVNTLTKGLRQIANAILPARTPFDLRKRLCAPRPRYQNKNERSPPP